MTTSAKAIGAAASSLILLGSAALAAAPAVMDITADASPAAATQQATEASAAAEATGVQRVEGQFSYDQGVVTSNERYRLGRSPKRQLLCARPQPTATACTRPRPSECRSRVCRPWRPQWPRWPRRRAPIPMCSAAPGASNAPGGRRHRQCRGVGRVLRLAYDHGRRLKQGRRSSSSVG